MSSKGHFFKEMIPYFGKLNHVLKTKFVEIFKNHEHYKDVILLTPLTEMIMNHFENLFSTTDSILSSFIKMFLDLKL